jgi:hypothetical protein
MGVPVCCGRSVRLIVCRVIETQVNPDDNRTAQTGLPKPPLPQITIGSDESTKA